MQLATGGPIYLARTRSSGPIQLAGDTGLHGQQFRGRPPDLSAPQRAFVSHRAPGVVRQFMGRVAQSAYGRAFIADRVFPIRRLRKQPGSAVRVIPE